MSEEEERDDEGRDEEGVTEEDLENEDESFLEMPPAEIHGEPELPQLEPLPGAIDVPPVPGVRREKPLD